MRSILPLVALVAVVHVAQPAETDPRPAGPVERLAPVSPELEFPERGPRAGPPQFGRLDDEVLAGSGEQVRIKTSDRVMLAGTYFAPKSKRGRGRAPGALLLHGAGGSQAQLRTLAAYLQKKGLGVLTLDLRGHGQSATKDLDWKELDGNARVALWAHAIKDAVAGAKFLRTRKEIHASNLTIVGFGAGCQLAVRHARGDGNARAVVLMDVEPNTLGSNIVRALTELEGLPTLLITSKAMRNTSERIQHACHKANDGIPYIEISVLPSNREALLTDKKLPSATYTWLIDQVMPKKR